MAKVKKQKNVYKLASIVVIIITLILVLGSGYLLFKAKSILRPDYAPGVVDKNAVPLPEDLKTRELTLYFQNPSKSTQNMVLEVIITQNEKETVIAKSDMLPVGYAIYKLKLQDDIKLLEGGYNGKFNIIYYDEITEEKAAVNTDIPITIAVE